MADTRVDVGFRRQPEQRAAFADAQDLAQVRRGEVHVRRGRVQSGVGQQRSHDRPAAAVVPARRQALAEVVAALVPVDAVEPVTGVVAVAVQRLGAQDVAAHLDERDALRQTDDALTHVLAAHPLGHADAGRQLENVLVEQRLVVVLLDVVNRFLRVVGEGRALAVPVRTAAAQRRAQLVGRNPQIRLRAIGVGVAVPVVAQAVDEALMADL